MEPNNILQKTLFFLLALPLLVFSQNNLDTLNISIRPTFNGENLNRDTWFITKNMDSVQFKKLKFYLTDFNLLYNNKNTTIADSNFLIDAFNTETLRLSLPNPSNEAITGISFNIGVEEHMNTDGVLAGDLDPSNGMYWSWQSGYINFKIEGVSPSCKTRKDKFQFHIGGYKAPHKTTRKTVLKLDAKEENNIILNLDLTSFFDTIDLQTTNQIMIPGKAAKDLADNLSQLFSVE